MISGTEGAGLPIRAEMGAVCILGTYFGRMIPMTKKPPNPDGNRGSFFAAPNRRKHLSEDQARNASQHVTYMLNELETAVEQADVPRETCEKYDDHTFEDCERFLHTMQCTRCGIMVEHPA